MDLETLAIQLSRSEQLPVLPQIAVAVLRIAANPDGNSRRLEDVLEQDTGLAARVLKVANSAYYGMPQKVRSINAATQLLGMRTLQSIVVSVAYHQLIEGKAAPGEFDNVAFWRHSLAVGCIARTLAHTVLPESKEELYTAGLLHDVGMLVLATFYPEEFDKVVVVSRLGILPQALAEEHIFGFTSADAGALLAQKWGFGSILEDAVRRHSSVGPADRVHRATALISVANTLAHEAGLTNQSGPYPVPIDKGALEAAEITNAKLEEIRANIDNVVGSAEDVYRIRHRAA